jgi:hypothetical protein
VARSARRARWLARAARRLFVTAPMPGLEEPAGLKERVDSNRLAIRVVT